MNFVINGKDVNLERALPHAKPFKQMLTGELRLLDRLGFVMMDRDLGRDRLSYDDLFGLVAYFAMKANPALRVADLDKLSAEDFGKIAAIVVEHFFPVLFPQEAQEEGGTSETPFAEASAKEPTPSVASSGGAPETSIG